MSIAFPSDFQQRMGNGAQDSKDAPTIIQVDNIYRHLAPLKQALTCTLHGLAIPVPLALQPNSSVNLQ